MFLIQVKTLGEIDRELRSRSEHRNLLVENIEIANISLRLAKLEKVTVQPKAHLVSGRSACVLEHQYENDLFTHLK